MNSHSVEKLVIAASEGNREAYAELIGGHYKSIYLTCLAVLGYQADAEDAAQDAVLQGFIRLRSLRDPKKFGAWMTQIARNRCINLSRRKRRTLKYTSGPVKATEPDDRFEELMQAIEDLPVELRIPLILYYFDGRSVRDVADKTEMSVSNVYLKLGNAIQQLHAILMRQGIEP
ncbi:MAG: sigma-70 family RNA polymerase sigma factor [Sedimentisphaerales bacterium]|nr:sigma-70 family RNA polymerase sigma factor [Sedimentisphaerales bacterium]